MLICLIILIIVSIGLLRVLVMLNNNIVMADQNAAGRALAIMDALKTLKENNR